MDNRKNVYIYRDCNYYVSTLNYKVNLKLVMNR